MDQRRQLAEDRAAGLVVAAVLEDARAAWPKMHAHLRELTTDRFEFEPERPQWADFDVGLTLLAMELLSLQNLFPPDQAERLTAATFRYINTPEYGEYTTSEIEAYQRAFRGAVESGDDPLQTLAARLIRRLLGERTRQVANVQSLLIVSGWLAELVGRWKAVPTEFELVRGDDFDPSPTGPTGESQSSSVPRPVDLQQLRMGFAGRRFAELIQHHIRRQSTQQIAAGSIGTTDLLPTAAHALAEAFIDRLNARIYDGQFWRTDCAIVFDAMIVDGREVLTAAAVPTDDETLFHMFQLVTMSYALAAAEQPQMRKLMGIRKGIFRR
ncbi:MAG: hypothetical protein ACRDI2_10490 [Chloroflexota bacterium]